MEIDWFGKKNCELWFEIDCGIGDLWCDQLKNIDIGIKKSIFFVWVITFQKQSMAMSSHPIESEAWTAVIYSSKQLIGPMAITNSQHVLGISVIESYSVHECGLK